MALHGQFNHDRVGFLLFSEISLKTGKNNMKIFACHVVVSIIITSGVVWSRDPHYVLFFGGNNENVTRAEYKSV